MELHTFKVIVARYLISLFPNMHFSKGMYYISSNRTPPLATMFKEFKFV